ncbi:MAG: divalent-cation tolerance protein CutA [Chloroflexia bacterium]|nr:divalent-cation tolerance protein CutA [Chloroflexia bacterium]
MEAIIVLCTVPTEESAQQIAQALVQDHLAACVNILPGIRSIYYWKDKICDDPELLLLIKSRQELFPLLQRRLQSLHPYEVPEILSLPVQEGAPTFLEWLLRATEVEPAPEE